MFGQISGNTKTFEADAAIAKHARVTLEADGKIVTAGLAVLDIGTALNEAYAAGDDVAVHLRTAGGTEKMIAAEASAAGAVLYTDASGKVQDTSTSTAYIVGHAVDAATADGDIIEVIRGAAQVAVV